MFSYLKSCFVFPILLLLFQEFTSASSSSSNDFSFIQTTMTLTAGFECKNQLKECFQTRFASCFARESWFENPIAPVSPSVYRTALPWGAANISVAPFVIVIFQLIDKKTGMPSVEATTGLMNDVMIGDGARKCVWKGIGGSPTKVATFAPDSRNGGGDDEGQQQQVPHQEDGFKMLAPWRDPAPLAVELSENWFGVGVGVLCSFIPCLFVSVNVYRRWRKYSRSVRNYRRVMRELRGEEVSSSSSSSSDGDVISRFNNNNNNKKKQAQLGGEDKRDDQDKDVELISKASQQKRDNNNNESEMSVKAPIEMNSSTASNNSGEGKFAEI